MTPLHVQGMHGMGDNLHQRAVVRDLIKSREVWLETPWPSIYHDLVGERLRLVNKHSSLRTQAKNARREAHRYSGGRPPAGATSLKVWYSVDQVRERGSVLGAMLAACGMPDASHDFRLPVPAQWTDAADRLIAGWNPQKPILLLRPLVERREWGGCRARNPDHAAYAELFRSIRDRYFVVSVADLVPGVEWLAAEPMGADVELHAGELVFEVLAGLMLRAALTVCSPGFATILAQAVGTPSVCVFGGYEDGRSFTAGAAYTPHLAIQPINPCCCFRHNHACDKRIDLPAATEALTRFLDGPAANRAA